MPPPQPPLTISFHDLIKHHIDRLRFEFAWCLFLMEAGDLRFGYESLRRHWAFLTMSFLDVVCDIVGEDHAY